MSTITFKLDDDFNERTVEFKTTLFGDTVSHYYEAFEYFLLSAGFVQASIDKWHDEQ